MKAGVKVRSFRDVIAHGPFRTRHLICEASVAGENAGLERRKQGGNIATSPTAAARAAGLPDECCSQIPVNPQLIGWISESVIRRRSR